MTSTKDTNPKDAVGVRKVPVNTVPGNVILEQALALLEGSCKYGGHNWRVAGVRASVYYSAAMGHLIDWWEGQDLDQDSGLNHVAKAIASLIVLRDAMMREMWVDDRPPRNGVEGWKSQMNAQAAAILDRYPERKEPFTEALERVRPGAPLVEIQLNGVDGPQGVRAKLAALRAEAAIRVVHLRFDSQTDCTALCGLKITPLILVKVPNSVDAASGLSAGEHWCVTCFEELTKIRRKESAP